MAATFQQNSDTTRSHALAQAADHSSCYQNVLHDGEGRARRRRQQAFGPEVAESRVHTPAAEAEHYGCEAVKHSRLQKVGLNVTASTYVSCMAHVGTAVPGSCGYRKLFSRLCAQMLASSPGMTQL